MLRVDGSQSNCLHHNFRHPPSAMLDECGCCDAKLSASAVQSACCQRQLAVPHAHGRTRRVWWETLRPSKDFKSR